MCVCQPNVSVVSIIVLGRVHVVKSAITRASVDHYVQFRLVDNYLHIQGGPECNYHEIEATGGHLEATNLLDMLVLK